MNTTELNDIEHCVYFDNGFCNLKQTDCSKDLCTDWIEDCCSTLPNPD
jgi:hypothetical protein